MQLWSEVEDRCCHICVDYFFIYPSEEWNWGGPEVVTPGIDMAAISVISEVRYMEKIKYRQHQQKKSQNIFFGWCHVPLETFGYVANLQRPSHSSFPVLSFRPHPAWLMLLAPAFIVTCVSISKNKWEDEAVHSFCKAEAHGKSAVGGPFFCFLYISEYRNSSQNH